MDYYDVKAVSASSLAWFEISPFYFWSMLNKEVDEEQKHYYIEGDKIHKYILEPENYKYLVLDYTRPTSPQQKIFCEKLASFKKGSIEDKLIKAYKAAYVVKGNVKDKDVLDKAYELKEKYSDYIKYLKLRHVYDFIFSTKENKHMELIKDTIMSHKKAQELINISNDEFNDVIDKTEYEIYWEYDNIKCKSKLDKVYINFTKKKILLIDLKTTSSLSDFDKHSFVKFKYYRQLAFYKMAIKWLLENKYEVSFDDFDFEAYIIAVNKKEPIEVKVFKAKDEVINFGQEEINKLLSEIKWHYDNEKWKYPRKYYEGNGVIEIKLDTIKNESSTD